MIPIPYEQGKFKVYVERAKTAGVIESGKMATEGQHWMRLTVGPPLLRQRHELNEQH